LLADPFEEGRFVLSPNGKKDPQADRERYETLELVWQLRHTVVHNVGVITRSDAVKFRLMVKEIVDSPRLLVPTRDDVRYLTRFLDETAQVCNDRIGQRVAEVLTAIHGRDPTLFAPQDFANQVTRSFSIPLVVAGSTGVLPPPREPVSLRKLWSRRDRRAWKLAELLAILLATLARTSRPAAS
jgi:hypothetical protein